MPIENILLVIGVLLLAAKIFGEIAERLGVASLVGELVGGVIVGPILGLISTQGFVQDFITIPVIFLLFMAGLEIRFSDIKQYIYPASILATFGGIASFILGAAVGMIFFDNVIIAFAIGVVLVSTSNGTLFLFLKKSGEFDSKIGKFIVAISIADDIVGILFLSFFSVFTRLHIIAFGDILQLFFISIGFYFVMFTVGSRIMNYILNFVGKFITEDVIFVVPLGIAFFLAYFTENIGLTIAAGSFLTGMVVANSHYSESVVSPKAKIIGNGFLIPLLYGTVGSLLVLSDLNVFLILAITAVAVVGKVVGVGLMSRFFGVRRDNIKLVAISMIPRGNENIAIVQIVFFLGVITFSVYTSLIFAMIVTILITPIFLKLFYKK